MKTRFLFKSFLLSFSVLVLAGCGADKKTAEKNLHENDTLLTETSVQDTLTNNSIKEAPISYASNGILSNIDPLNKIKNSDSLHPFQSTVNGKYGYRNGAGKTMIKAKFDVAGNFYGNSAPVIYHGKHGFCDTSGTVNYCNGYLFATLVSELSGETFITGAGEGLIAITDKKGKFGFANYTGKISIACAYDNAQYFSEGLAAVKKKGRYGFIDTAGKTAIDFKYEEVNFFSNNRACVKTANKYGYIDRQGKLVIPAVYTHTYFFSEGLAYASKEESRTYYFYIDTSGKTVIKGLFEEAAPFENGKATVQKNGNCIEIDKTGKKLKYLGKHCFEGC
ncbi:MAG: WG repeat-containing protein [Bacteroidia bacterium]|nr:WG repeat-containing protein [Bacteroidia bacterium]